MKILKCHIHYVEPSSLGHASLLWGFTYITGGYGCQNSKGSLIQSNTGCALFAFWDQTSTTSTVNTQVKGYILVKVYSLIKIAMSKFWNG